MELQRAQYPDSPPSEWSQVLNLNLGAPMLATQLCLEPMEANGGGAVVNIASSAGLGPDAYASPEYGRANQSPYPLETAGIDPR